MWLLVDAGNSSVKWGFYSGGRLSRLDRRVATTRPEREAAAAALVRAAQDAGAARIGVASVVPQFTQPLEALAGQAGIGIVPVSAAMRTPFTSVYKSPETLGADRIAAVAGAVSGYRKDHPEKYLIIVLAGTAVTIEVVDPLDVHLGGLITAGPDLIAHALHAGTAQLPEVPLDLPERLPGRSTAESIQGGVLYGVIESINGLVERLARDRSTLVLLCGGWARLLREHLSREAVVDQELILKGTAVLMELNSTSG